MTAHEQTTPGPPRDLIGYGRRTPRVVWPDDAKVAVNIVVNYEEGSEHSSPPATPPTTAWPRSPTRWTDEYRDLCSRVRLRVRQPRGDLAAHARSSTSTRSRPRSSPRPSRSSATPRSAGAIQRRPATSRAPTAGAGASTGCSTATRSGSSIELSDRVDQPHLRRAPGRLVLPLRPRACTRASCSSRRAASSTTPTPTTTTSPTSSRSRASGHLVVPYTLVYNDIRFVLAQGFGGPGSTSPTSAGAASTSCGARAQPATRR